MVIQNIWRTEIVQINISTVTNLFQTPEVGFCESLLLWSFTLPGWWYPWAAWRTRPPAGRRGRSSSPWRRCGARKPSSAPRCQCCCNGDNVNHHYNHKTFSTYNRKVSLNFGGQFLFCLVANFLFLSARCGPIRFTSTYGFMPCWDLGIFRSLAATTADEETSEQCNLSHLLRHFLTFHVDLVLPGAGVRVEVHLHRHLAHAALGGRGGV